MDCDYILREYPYFYETHLHTNASSACGKSTPEDMAIACKEYGYTGIIITDHNWGGNTCIDRTLPWKDWVTAYCDAYRRAKNIGDEIGIDVFFGYEAGYKGTEFLIYGVDEEFIKEHSELKTASIEEQFDIIHGGGGIVVHAHPFREESYIPEIRLFPEHIDAVEGVNASHTGSASEHELHPEFDERAREYAKKLGLPMTAGSDVHKTDIIGGGIRTKKRLKDINDFKELILSGKDYVLFDTINYYEPR
ncbi:MAG: PHP domain-containing protein [Lachnospiraceae bacterium]|nr:PHP domain-containing protein [Lachnospiraceae bacterium]